MNMSRVLLASLAAAWIITYLLAPAPVLSQDQDETEAVPTTSRSEETVVAYDTFDDPATGLLEEQPREPDDLRLAYDDGQFEIDALQGDFSGTLSAPFGAIYSDVTVAVDAVLAGDERTSPGRYLFLTCRLGEDSTGYRFEYRPEIPEVALRRLDPEDNTRMVSVNLDADEFSDVDSVHRLELSCNGETITARIDEQVVATAVDSAYAEGRLDLGAGVYLVSSGPVSADFEDLAISVPTTVEVPATAPELDRTAALAPATQLQELANANPPVFGPESGTIVQSSESLDSQYANINVANFSASVTFANPAGDAAGPWDMGIGFRQDDSGDHWRVIVRSDGTWSLAKGAGAPTSQGLVDSLDLAPEGMNTIDLLVNGPIGYLLVNDEFAALFDISAWQESGDIWASSGFFTDFSSPERSISFAEFTVRPIGEAPQPTPTQAPQGSTTDDLATETGQPEESTPTSSETIEGTPIPSPVAETDPEAESEMAAIREDILDSEPDFGPESGSVAQSLGAIDIENAAVDVENFYTRARLSNPASADDPDHPWDILIGFWHQGGDDQARFVISSDGTWSVSEGTARPTVTGEATGLLLGPARGNDIELAVVDGIGYLTINGAFVDSFEVPGIPTAGDIWIASGTFPENVQEGIEAPFSDWSVWSLDE